MNAALDRSPLILSTTEFEFFRSMIMKLAGISLSGAKLELVGSRLRNRVITLGLSSFAAYAEYLRSLPEEDSEWTLFINLLTTNKTDWFREPQHFSYLVNEFLPKWKTLGKNKLTVWCAASSTGEEPYTLSLVLNEAFKGTDFEYEIFASDIDTNVLWVASNGVYQRSRLEQVPESYKFCFSLGRGEISDWMKVKREYREKVSFHRINLANDPFPWQNEIDLIFCRNVLIYFNSEVIEEVVTKLFHSGGKDSVLVIAHSESLQNVKSPWKYLRPSIYVKGKVFLP